MYNIKLTIIILLIIIQKCNCNNGNLAREKCEEYGRLVYVGEISPILHIHAKNESVSKCGIVEVPLIIGGVKASKAEFPHMVIIGFGSHINADNLGWHCGGSLISENFVLTAAHCLHHNEKGDAQRVRLGIIYLNANDENVQEIKISERILHPEFSPKSKYNDIALLKLLKSAKFTEFVRPACVNNELTYSWTKSLATGFGKLAYDDENGSLDLMKVQISNINEEDCRTAYKSFRPMTEGVIPSQFCAGELAGRKDTCQGDSGGPLQTVLEKPYCMYNIIGITSFGKFCGFENSPGIYTNVASYIEWIEKIVWNQ